MRDEKLLWVISRFAIVSSSAWLLIACSSNERNVKESYYVPDAGPTPCTVTTADAPACQMLVEPILADAGDASTDDAGGDLDASADDADAPDATIYAGDASCPLGVTSEIQCGDLAPSALTVAANEKGEAYAAIISQISTGSATFGSQLVDLKPDGTGTTSLEPVPRSESMRAIAVSNADGSPGVVGDSSPMGLRYYAENGDAWNAEDVPGSVQNDFSLNGAAASRSGAVFALLVNDATHASISTRAPAGGWTTGAAIVLPDATMSSLALDVEGTPYVLGYGYDASGTNSSFLLSTGSAAPVSFPAPSQLSEAATIAIAGASGAPKDALAFVKNDSESSVDVYDLADRNAQRSIGGFVSGTCPSFTIGFTCDDCQVGAQCDTYEDNIDGYATALTSDGTVWVAYIASSVDEVSVVELDTDPILPLGCVCTTSTQSTKALSATIVVEPLGAKGADTGVSLRIPVPTDDAPTAIAMTAAGSTLHVFATKYGKISHVAIDASKVPH